MILNFQKPVMLIRPYTFFCGAFYVSTEAKGLNVTAEEVAMVKIFQCDVKDNRNDGGWSSYCGLC